MTENEIRELQNENKELKRLNKKYLQAFIEFRDINLSDYFGFKDAIDDMRKFAGEVVEESEINKVN